MDLLDRFEAIIFDNDGVIVNSEPLSCQALHDLLEEQYEIDIGDDFSAVIGSSDTYAINYYLQQHQKELKHDIHDLINRKMEIYYNIAQGKLQYFEGFHKLMQQLQQNFDLAIASSGSHDKIKFSLDQVEASKYFPIICSATEVKQGKPAPDLFLFTAECLSIVPTKCIVIEDSIKGIKGAKAAGMFAIGFTSSFDRDTLVEAGADLVVNSFEELQDHFFS